MIDVFENIDNYNPLRKPKVLIVFDDMIADIMTNKKCQQILEELFIRSRKTNISLVFISKSYFFVPKNVRLNCMHYYIMKISNQIELSNIAQNHTSDIVYKDFLKMYCNYTKKTFDFFTIENTLPSDNSLKYHQNLL